MRGDSEFSGQVYAILHRVVDANRPPLEVQLRMTSAPRITVDFLVRYPEDMHTITVGRYFQPDSQTSPLTMGSQEFEVPLIPENAYEVQERVGDALAILDSLRFKYTILDPDTGIPRKRRVGL